MKYCIFFMIIDCQKITKNLLKRKKIKKKLKKNKKKKIQIKKQMK